MKKILSNVLIALVAIVSFTSCMKEPMNPVHTKRRITDNLAFPNVKYFPDPDFMQNGEVVTGQGYLIDAPVGRTETNASTGDFKLHGEYVILINQVVDGIKTQGVPLTVTIAHTPEDLSFWEQKGPGEWDWYMLDYNGKEFGYGVYHYYDYQLFPVTIAWKMNQRTNKFELVATAF